MSRYVAAGTALVAAVTTLAMTGTASAQTAPRTTPTSYLLQGNGNGLEVVGGSLPATSGKLAHVASGCTTRAPLDTTNSTAKVALPGGIGSIGAITTRTWTTSNDGTVSRYTRSRVADITVGNTALGSLNIQGLSIQTRAWHDKHGFHASVTPTAAKVSVKSPLPLPGRSSLPTTLPAPGKSFTIPGLVTVGMGTSSKTVGAHSAQASAHGLSLDLLASGTKLDIGYGIARISDQVRSGIFGGSAAATSVRLLGSTVASNGQPEVYVPCVGTGGRTTRLSVASVPLTKVDAPLSVGAASSFATARQTATVATGHTRAYVANVDLGNGALVVKGLQAEANATRSGARHNVVKVSKAGTHAASITVGGRTLTLSQLNGRTLSIPGLSGLAKIQTGVSQGIKANGHVIGLRVVGLRITLLGASGATTSTIDLATTAFQVRHP